MRRYTKEGAGKGEKDKQTQTTKGVQEWFVEDVNQAWGLSVSDQRVWAGAQPGGWRAARPPEPGQPAERLCTCAMT
jgi:hypothetical protein